MDLTVGQYLAGIFRFYYLPFFIILDSCVLSKVQLHERIMVGVFLDGICPCKILSAIYDSLSALSSPVSIRIVCCVWAVSMLSREV